MNRKEQMLYLRNRNSKKFTFEEVGLLYGISRQRVHQIVNNNHWTGKVGRPRKENNI